MFAAILTLFPEAVEAYLASSILGKAQEKGLLEVRLVDFRDFARDRHRTVDDRPFGGGPGMVLKPEPILDAVEWLERTHGTFRKILLSPAGRRFDQAKALEFSSVERLCLICGRYEGYDERIRLEMECEEISMGDYVLAGGELPALAVLEAAARHVPGVLGHEDSAEQESFQNEGGLDHPHFTRPRVFRGHAVPEVLLSGDHEAIARWRSREADQRTRDRRADPRASETNENTNHTQEAEPGTAPTDPCA